MAESCPTPSPATRLRVALTAAYPAAPLVPDAEIRRRHRDAEHPASWIRAVLRAVGSLPDIEVRVFVHSRAARRRRTVVEDRTTFEFLPRRIPLRCDPFLLYWPTTRALARALRDFRPHVVHAFGTEVCYGPAATRLPHPCIVSMQGIVALLRPHFHGRAWAWAIQERLERAALRRANRVVAETAFVKRWVESAAPGADVTVLPTPVNEEFFSVPAGAKPPQILCVGSFSPWKNMAGVVRAFARCGAEDATLTFAGDGPERAGCEDLAAQLGIGSRTRFLGTCTRERILAELAATRVLALATRMDSAPNVLVEAHAAGVPVVATACGGVPDLVRDGEDGFLTPPDDTDAMAGRLRILLQDAAKAAAMGAAGRRTVLARHAPSVIGPRLEALYRETAATGRR